MILDNEELQDMVDYSFGDHSGVLGGVPNAYMKKANLENLEFFRFVILSEKPVLSLFIDNIRLYRRPLEYSDWLHKKPISIQDKQWLSQFNDEDLLELCSRFPEKKFVIFTAFEDTPLDDYIWGKIPENVLSINCANGVIFGGVIRPFPHGLERIMYQGYNHHELLQEAMASPTEPSKLLFVAHREDTGDRKSIGQLFKSWATVTHLPYEEYLKGIQDHKFVLCPSGNGIESARNWETLYLRRVPIFKRHPYLEEMFKDFPVLFVDEWEEVTEQLLKDNEHLFDEMQNINPDLLDLNKIYDIRLNADL